MREASEPIGLRRGDPAIYVVSPEVAESLEAELVVLRERKLREISERLRDARDFGDAADNDEHMAIREEEVVLDARIAALEETIRRTRVSDGGTFRSGAVIIGSTVMVEDLDSGEADSYKIVGMHERIEPGEVSAASPIGQALLGRRAGERVTVDLPRGRSRRLAIVATTVPGLAGEAVA
jgi:transcription elongation factor GreA